jgi:hypothetical protein
MKWFGSLFVLLHNISKRSSSQILQFISLLLCFPVFKANDFFFKITYSLNQRRLLILSIKQGGLRGGDLAVQLDSLFEKFCRVPKSRSGKKLSLENRL